MLVALAATVIQLIPSARSALLYQRYAVEHGEWWRLWTGHLVHFGWPHFLVDVGLLIGVGWFSEGRHRSFTYWAFALMPPAICAVIYWFDPSMIRYGGLSALNLGLLLYVAIQGWRRDWSDWFWPAIVVAYIGELLWEHFRGGQGGGAIRFDDESIRVATSAHLASAAYALAAVAATRLWRRAPPRPVDSMPN